MKKLGDILYPIDDMGKARANRLHDDVDRVHALVCNGGYALLPFRRLEAKNALLQEIYGMFPREGGAATAAGGEAQMPAAAWREARLNMHREPLWSAVGRKLCELGCGVAFAHLQGTIAGTGKEAGAKSEGEASGQEAEARNEAGGGEAAGMRSAGETSEAEHPEAGHAATGPRKRDRKAKPSAAAQAMSETAAAGEGEAGESGASVAAAAPKKRSRTAKPSAALQARSVTTAAGEGEAPKAAKDAKPRSRAPTAITAAADKTQLGEAKSPPHKRTQATGTAAGAGTRLGAANAPVP